MYSAAARPRWKKRGISVRLFFVMLTLIWVTPSLSLSTKVDNASLVVEDTAASTTPPPSQWSGPLFVEPKTIRPSKKTLKVRIEAEKRKPEISEPIVLRLKTTQLRPLLAQLASDSAFRKMNRSSRAAFKLMKSLESRIEKKASDAINLDSTRPTVALLTLTPADLSWLDLEKLSHALSYPSLEPFIDADEVKSLHAGHEMVVKRWQKHFGGRFEHVRSLAEGWLAANPKAMQMSFAELLPNHMQRLLGRYSPFRGRNCFATALQFADPKIIQTKNINLVREAGHSLALINHDEFSHALWLGYEELTPERVNLGLEFGDLIAIADGKYNDAYNSFKHAFIHVAGDVYLHKPSKSASSPIEFIRWKDLVQIWKPLVKQFEVRFFRRRPATLLKEQSPELAIEKIKWNR